MFAQIMGSPYRFFLAAAVLAAILCLFPARVEDVPEQPGSLMASQAASPRPQAAQDAQDMMEAAGNRAALQDEAAPQEQPAGADFSERTAAGCFLHRTLYYAPCGHSVQRREALPAQLVGLSRVPLEQEIGQVIPGAAVTGFSAGEVDIALSTKIPCPLHWVLRSGEDGKLAVLQNRSGEALETVRTTDIPLAQAPQEEQEELREGRIFDDVQALEGYLESLSS